MVVGLLVAGMYGDVGNHMIYVRIYPLGFGVVSVDCGYVFCRGFEMCCFLMLKPFWRKSNEKMEY